MTFDFNAAAINDYWLETLNWQPDLAQQEQFQQLYRGVLAGNQQFNLTRITEPDEFWEKHLWDSLRGVLPWLTHEAPLSAIDIGTGGGFPGIPIAIACPGWTITLLDSTRKKMTFLETLVADLGLPMVKTVCDRAEAAGRHRDHREQYDLALVRAVGAVSICTEYALPLVKLGGQAVLYRGQWTDEEATLLQSVVPMLGGEIESIDSFTTPLSNSVRHCIYLRKVEATSWQFPRAIGIPAKQPLT